jgi:tetratricopeptide (TPR) repeat protein
VNLADIFISYSKQDHDQARLLAAFLEANGYSVWRDISLLSGDKYRKVIMKELRRSRAAIVIWTENSIGSDWVQSEAGRARAVQKLIPVKTRGLEYKDIPPPFDNMHIESIDARDKILVAVVAQLTKSALQSNALWLATKTTRYQLLTWFGIVGGAITLFGNLQGALNLADWARWLVANWHDLTVGFWRAFGWIGIHVPKQWVPLLSFVLFGGVTAYGAWVSAITSSTVCASSWRDTFKELSNLLKDRVFGEPEDFYRRHPGLAGAMGGLLFFFVLPICVAPIAMLANCPLEAITKRFLFLAIGVVFLVGLNEISPFAPLIRVWLNPKTSIADYANVFNNRGNAYHDKKDYGRAIADYTKAIEIDPNNANAYKNRGDAYDDEKDYDRAIADYTKAIEIDPKYANVHYNRGLTYSNKKDYDRAIADYTKAIEIDPNYGNTFFKRGNAYYAKKDYGRAIADYNKAIEIDPKNANAYKNRGDAYYDEKNYDSAIAIADYTRAIEINPRYAGAYNNRGSVYRNKKDYDSAIADYTKVIEIDPKYFNVYFNRGLAYRNKDENDRAIADYTKAIEIDPKSAWAYNARAWAYFKAGKAVQGLPDAEKSLELRPNDAETLDTRGSIFESLGRKEEAIADFRKALKINSNLESSKEGLKRLGVSP